MYGPSTGPSRLRAWERDVINRQRNIVFPDTVLNEGRFYRNIASGRAVFSRGQKIGLICVLAFFILVNAADVAATLGEFLNQDHSQPQGWIVWPSLASFGWLLFWLFLTIKGLFPPAQQKKRRRCYRHSIKNRQ